MATNRVWITIRVMEICKKKLQFIELQEEAITQLKKAQAYDRKKVWIKLKKDLQEIKRMRIAA